MKEIWKPIIGWRGVYEVSNLGRVKSLPRVIIRSTGSSQTIRARMLKCGGSGYPQVRLSTKCKARTYQVHVLVATAFLEKPRGADRVCHKDDDYTDNRASNLYWGTSTTNTADAFANGKRTRVVTEKVVMRIRRLRRSGYSLRSIADTVGLSKRSVLNVVNNNHRFANTV